LLNGPRKRKRKSGAKRGDTGAHFTKKGSGGKRRGGNRTGNAGESRVARWGKKKLQRWSARGERKKLTKGAGGETRDSVAQRSHPALVKNSRSKVVKKDGTPCGKPLRRSSSTPREVGPGKTTHPRPNTAKCDGRTATVLKRPAQLLVLSQGGQSLRKGSLERAGSPILQKINITNVKKMREWADRLYFSLEKGENVLSNPSAKAKYDSPSGSNYVMSFRYEIITKKDKAPHRNAVDQQRPTGR